MPAGCPEFTRIEHKTKNYQHFIISGESKPKLVHSAPGDLTYKNHHSSLTIPDSAFECYFQASK